MNIKSPSYADIPSLRKLWQEAFGDTDEFLDLFFAHGFSQNRCRFIEDCGCAVAVLYWFDCEHNGKKLAYIYAVATAKTHRGKGLCHQLMEHTHNYLKCSGYTGVILVPGSASLFRFYESMGYKTACYVHEFICDAANTKARLTNITKEEYGILRKGFLNDNCVIQENENLEFLSSYAGFYETDGAVFAAFTDEGNLICPEILGDISKAGHIVSALECKSGNFRTMGKGKPFAMYLPLTADSTPPSYFGFAFD